MATMPRVPTSVQRHLPAPVRNSHPMKKSPWLMPVDRNSSMFMELRNIAFSKWAAGITSWKEDVQTFLREVVIVGQDVRQACTAHHLHGHTIGEAVGLVR